MQLLPPRKRQRPLRTARTRGTAEIELMLVIPVLLTILFIIGAMLVIGPARILNVFRAESESYQDATTAQVPAFAVNSDIQLVDPVTATEAPHLDELQQANRVHQSTTTKELNVSIGKARLPAVTLTDTAEFTSPAWAYSSWPAGSDSAFAEEWVEDYAAESTAQWQDALGLQPAWTP